MKHEIAEFDFFERGLALMVASLDDGTQLLTELSQEQSEALDILIDRLVDVEDSEGWSEFNHDLKGFDEELFQDEKYLNDKELYLALTEPVYLGKYLDLLLIGHNYQDLDLLSAQEVIKDNFASVIQKIITFPQLNNHFSDEVIKVIKILATTTNLNDLNEGFLIVFAQALQEFKILKDETLALFDLLIETDALLSYWSFLTSDIDAE
ncbi:hypothetical protein LD125_00339 [Mesoplasma sp. JKS002658]|uniref:hypothetical protein n=1 Tax=Mesoplasma whartonense TaxID=2878854 RepID=UPI002022B527|nr:MULTISPECIES: hypothetical protein [unclassified Mesoplasma]MCL8211157.1 hypothetical protein [Mesoplasma sp. JKS002664]MCL8211818.1 hypothetical protein [Mesoplasma sp. JKS002662]MCL8214077.1 hypothetical protein [Mesoplasma sp. JKS002658]MCL8214495.1 hypothetical protein [Mesoplasma sp. JKS002663]MCL8215396.1 hypothetical protein [Mesoplasma sp. JKS002659]